MADEKPIRVTDVRLVIGATIHVVGEREEVIRTLNDHSLGSKLMDFTAIGHNDGIQYPMSFARSFVMYVGLTHDFVKEEEVPTPTGTVEVTLG